jgi:uncharacterized protein (TIGR02594 family)
MSLVWMNTAKSLVGTKEFPGNANNPEIIHWAKMVGGFASKYYTADSIPWCGLFVAHCLEAADASVPSNPLSALAYADWGTRLNEPSFGAVMVFKRSGGGHVGFYVGEDDESYHILGGNQSDMVDVTRVGKERLHAIRWPSEVELVHTGPIVEEYAGPLSVNEQ